MQLQHSIYHLADRVNWPSINRYGLLSTHALLDLVEVSWRARMHIERRHRADQVVLPNGIVIRDQKPMPPAALERCLRGLTPIEWYALLNKKVFFWFDVERLNRMRQACCQRPQVVMIIDTQRLLARHAERVALAPINTGNARRQPALRGPQTFVPYPLWIESGWTSETEALGTRRRPRSHRPVELTITHAAPDIMDFVVDVRQLGSGELFHL
jgi:hypothetical protein